MATLHVLKVFVGEGGIGGNPLGVFLEVKLSSKDATRERILFLIPAFHLQNTNFFERARQDSNLRPAD
jgi:hypothetical protein